MSERTTIVLRVAALFLALGGVILCTSSCQSKESPMSDGPGVLYFYSPT